MLRASRRAAGNLRTAANRFDSAKGLAAFLLAAVVSAMLVVADQVMSTWADGHLMAAWIVMWAIAFSVLAMFAGTARRFSRNVIALGNEWAAASAARRRADARLWAVASNDPRVMADLQAAMLPQRSRQRSTVARRNAGTGGQDRPAGRRRRRSPGRQRLAPRGRDAPAPAQALHALHVSPAPQA
ncbi:MAG: hypothetical protein IPK34_09590 [Ramlibacter sp.]|nr:hypothetical protein [Ramlibacter sp.]